MPLNRCTLPTGSKGWKWGNQGKCYSSRKKALAQGLAENKGDEDAFRKDLAKGEHQATEDELKKITDPPVPDKFKNIYLNSVASYCDLEAARAYISEDERKKIPSSDFAGPGRSYPINSQAHVDAAAKLVGRAPKGDQAKIKAKIKEIAKRKGFSLPKAWQDED